MPFKKMKATHKIRFDEIRFLTDGVIENGLARPIGC